MPIGIAEEVEFKTLDQLKELSESLGDVKTDDGTYIAANPQVETKAVDAMFKADEDGEEGDITAIVSVFNNADLYRDVSREGSFAKGLADYKSADSPELDPLPMVFAHGASRIENFVGEWSDWKELPPGHELLPRKLKEYGGLWLRGSFDLKDIDGNPDRDVRKLYRNVKGGRIKQFSYRYRATKYAYIEFEGKYLRELLEQKISEAGPCLVGVNPMTELLDVKSASIAGNGAPLHGKLSTSLSPTDVTLTLLRLAEL